MKTPPLSPMLKGSEQRLLRGYGPVACAAVVFLAVALLAPTVAPQRFVTTTSGGSGQGSSGPGAGSSSSLSNRGLGASGVPTIPGLGIAKGCPGLQVPNDSYSPPCTSWSGGNNGGATSQGVTNKTITLALRKTDIMDLAALISALTGQHEQSASPDDVIRTYQVLTEYFNRHFQFYGRKLVIKVYGGKGSPADEALGGGQANAQADAITESQQLHAFADVSIAVPLFSEALISQHVISINPAYPSAAWFARHAPYAWGIWPDCTTVARTVIDFALKYLKGKPAVYAGGALKGQTRKVGLIFPDAPVYADCGTLIKTTLASAGMPIADARSYTLDFSTLQQDAQSNVNAFSSEGITTVLDLTDPVSTFFMTNYASQANWTPEWVEGQIGYVDTDWGAQLFNQAEWSHAFGPSSLGRPQPARATFGYDAYKSISPGSVPAEFSVSLIYQYLDLMAIGIQMAGPNLTPQTFGAGLEAYKSPGAGPQGRWAFPPGSYTAPQDVRIIWWDPNAISLYNGAQGAYVDNGRRYPVGGFPTGSPPIFPNGMGP